MDAYRMAALQRRLAAEEIDAFFCMSPSNIRYCSGFVGTLAYMLLTAEEKYLIADYRYYEQAQAQCPGFTVVRIEQGSAERTIAGLLESLRCRRLGFERQQLSFAFYESLQARLRGCALVATESFVEALRMVKTEDEIATLQKGAALSDAAYAHLLETVRPGMTELQLCRELEAFMLLHGSEERSFATILNSGARTSIPHGCPTEKRILPGDAVTVDFGATVNGYHTDCTRTFFVGACSQRQREMYRQVLDIQERMIAALRPGLAGWEAYTMARDMIVDAEARACFGKGLGHGVGLDIHEKPFMRTISTDVLTAGNVLTVEPGLYVPGFGGVRIEDMVVIGAQGNRVLTTAPKDLTIV